VPEILIIPQTVRFNISVILSEGEPAITFPPKTYPSRSRRTYVGEKENPAANSLHFS